MQNVKEQIVFEPFHITKLVKNGMSSIANNCQAFWMLRFL